MKNILCLVVLFSIQGHPVFAQPARNKLGHEERLVRTIFAPDCKHILSVGGSGSGDGPGAAEIFLWDLKTRKVIRRYVGHTQRVVRAAFSPGGKLLVTASLDRSLKLWEVHTGKVRGTFTGHKGMINAVTFSPDGKVVASGSGGWGEPELKLWDVNTGKLIRDLVGHKDGIRSVSFSPDGKKLASGSMDGTIKVWNSKSGGLLGTIGNSHRQINTVIFSPEGKFILSSFSECARGRGGPAAEETLIKFWKVKTGKNTRTFKGPDTTVGVAAGPGGKFILSTHCEGILRLWDSTGKVIHDFKNTTRNTGHGSFCADGKQLLTVDSYDMAATITDLKTLKTITKFSLGQR